MEEGPRAVSLLSDQEYRQLTRNLQSQFKFKTSADSYGDQPDGIRRQFPTESEKARGKVKSDPFLNRYLTYVDIYEARLLKGEEGVEQSIFDFLKTEIIDRLNASSGSSLRFDLMPAGSFYEGVKVKHANEFDYLLVPFIFDQSAGYQQRKEIGPSLSLTRNPLPTIKNTRDRPVHHISYFKLTTNDPNIEDALATLTGEPSSRGAAHAHGESIQARHVTENLRVMVCEALACGQSSAVTTNGPAVTLFLSCSGTKRKSMLDKSVNQYTVKVDLTLALKVKVPFEYVDEQDNRTTKTVELNELTARRRRNLTHEFGHCFFVTAGDFWQSSFSYHQTYIIRETAKENQTGFRAVKSLRDDLSLSDPLDNAILSTYPLKVAYLNETFNMDDEDAQRKGKETKWNAAEIDRHVIDMLQSIDEQGAERSMRDIFIKDNAVFHDADKSYLESRRLLRHLKLEKKLYSLHGRGHCSCLSIIMMLLLFVAITALTFNEAINYKELPKTTCITASISGGSVIVGLLCLLMGIVCFALTSCAFILVNRFCVKNQSKLYKLSFCCLLFLYSGALAFALALFTIVLLILILFYFARMDACQVVSDMETYFHVAAAIALAGVGLVLIYMAIFYLLLRFCRRGCMCGDTTWPRWDLCYGFRGTCVGVCCQADSHADCFAWFMCDDIFCRVCCRRGYEEGFFRSPLRVSISARALKNLQRTLSLDDAVEECIVSVPRESSETVQITGPTHREVEGDCPVTRSSEDEGMPANKSQVNVDAVSNDDTSQQAAPQTGELSGRSDTEDKTRQDKTKKRGNKTGGVAESPEEGTIKKRRNKNAKKTFGVEESEEKERRSRFPDEEEERAEISDKEG